MLLDAGVCTVCEVVTAGVSGMTQNYGLREKSEHYFGELTVGYGRLYAARQQNERIDMEIRVWRDRNIHTGDIAVVFGARYRVCQAQQRADEDGLPVTDLALERLSSGDILDQAEVIV